MAEDRYRAEFVEYADYLFFSAANQADPRILMELFLERKPEQVIIAGMGEQGCALGREMASIILKQLTWNDRLWIPTVPVIAWPLAF